MKQLVTFTLFILFNGILCSRILLVPMQGKSHMISVNSMGQELKSRGHEVYTLAEDYYKGKASKIGAVGLEILYYHIQEGTTYIDSDESQRRLNEMIMKEGHDFHLVSNAVMDSCKNMYADEELMKTIPKLKFDLFLIEAMPFVPCAYMLPHIFKIAHVSFIPGYFNFLVTGSVDLPSYLPSMAAVPDSLPMTFVERLVNTLFYIVSRRQVAPGLMRMTGVLSTLSDHSLIHEHKDKGLVADHIHTWFDLLDETQLFIITNADLAFDYPKPLFPNVISVEGLSVAPVKPLPKDIEDLVQSFEDGVIVVSFGSNVQYLPDEIVIKLVNTFRKRKELFLMRFSAKLSDENFKMPPNVKFMSWLPQNDLLGHNKTKLFITHGGLYGLHEAVYQGVPMLCVPLFGDQPHNARLLKAKGYGLHFRLVDFTEEEVLEKINEIISNPSYRQKTQRAGQIMRHRPMNARQTAAFWIEHVLQFGGEHLKPSSVHLTWWQFYCLDTLGVLIIAFLLILWIIFTIAKFIIKTILKLILPKSHKKKD